MARSVPLPATAQRAEYANYVRVEYIELRRDQYFIHFRDTVSDAELAIRCRWAVNAAGP